MAYPIEEKLVIAVASSALFALDEADTVFLNDGVRGAAFTRGNSPFRYIPAYNVSQ